MATDALANLNDVYQRSMLTGVPTTEYNAALAAAGFQPDQWYEATQALQKAGYGISKPTDANILKYGPEIAASGVGNKTSSPGYDVRQSLADRGFDPNIAGLDAGANNYYEQAQLRDTSNPLNRKISSLTSDLAALTTSYNNLVAKSNGTSTNTGGTGGTTVGGGTAVNAGGSNSNSSSTATTGVVYGPDGTMYSSAAAAIAAGVRNYTTTKPAGLITSSNSLGGQFVNSSAGATGNSNPGGLITGASQQLFQNPVTVQGPSVKTTNPFATTPK